MTTSRWAAGGGPARRRIARGAAAALSVAAAAGALAYLRDPPWLLHYTSGLRSWEVAADGTRLRSSGPHASLFVPADAREVRLRLRTTFEGPDDPPIAISIDLDDVSAERVVLAGPEWREVLIRLPRAGTRRVRRLDLRADRTRDGNRAFQLGEVTLGPVR